MEPISALRGAPSAPWRPYAACWEGRANTYRSPGPDKKEKTFGPEELLVLALPVYAGQIPAVPGLLDGLKGDNTPCILLATYGNRH